MYRSLFSCTWLLLLFTGLPLAAQAAGDIPSPLLAGLMLGAVVVVLGAIPVGLVFLVHYIQDKLSARLHHAKPLRGGYNRPN